VLVFKGKAEVIERLDVPLTSATSTFPWPHVIRLVTYVRVPRAVQRKISRRALFARDGWRCVYCGSSAGRLTLDHVVPRSRGGDSVWENVVTSCAPCNHKKGNRLLEEASMTLSSPPRPPAPVLFIQLAAPKIPDGWQPYLGRVASTAGAAAEASTRRRRLRTCELGSLVRMRSLTATIELLRLPSSPSPRAALRAAPTRSTSPGRACPRALRARGGAGRPQR
jgi:5-methylcytosine-specific restriction endonuclease McrA